MMPTMDSPNPEHRQRRLRRTGIRGMAECPPPLLGSGRTITRNLKRPLSSERRRQLMLGDVVCGPVMLRVEMRLVLHDQLLLSVSRSQPLRRRRSYKIVSVTDRDIWGSSSCHTD